MNTYSLYKNDELISRKSSRRNIVQYTGISQSMFVKCVDEGVTYKKIYKIKIDGEISNQWTEEFTEQWNDATKRLRKGHT